ncbi:MAG: hypothetical protein ACREO7_03705 [Pseudoxanthomonas sp.]
MTSKKTVPDRDASRNIGDEMLQAVRDVKTGKRGAKYSAEASVTERLNAVYAAERESVDPALAAAQHGVVDDEAW